MIALITVAIVRNSFYQNEESHQLPPLSKSTVSIFSWSNWNNFEYFLKQIPSNSCTFMQIAEKRYF